VGGPEEQILFIETAIRYQRQLQRVYLVLAGGVIVAGAALIVIAQWSGVGLIPDSIKQLVSVGGGFFSSLSSLPMKQWFDRRLKIAALELLVAKLRRAASGPAPSAEEAASLQQRFDKIWDLGLAA
jgi:hypothetical protein